MPKLRKLSQLKESRELTEDGDSNFARDKQNNSLSNTEEKEKPNIAGKLKYKDRLSLIKAYEKHSLNDQNQHPSNAVSEKPNPISDNDVAQYLNTLPDDDFSQNISGQIPSQKTKKLKIKRASKFFTDLQLQNGCVQQKQQLEDNEIRIERKQNRGADHLMEKVLQKAHTFKNRLCFKDLNKDDKFKNNIKDKLKSLQLFQEIEIVVEVPKVLGGRKCHAEAALFLKNNRDSGQNKMNSNNASQLEEIKQQSSLPKDRKYYYEDLQKQINLKRAQSLTESAMKECFKKSYLDETDFIYDLQQKKTNQSKQDYEKYSEISNKEISKDKSVSKSSFLYNKQEVKKEEIKQTKVEDRCEGQGLHASQESSVDKQQKQLKKDDHQDDQQLPAKSTKLTKPALTKPKKTKKRKGAFNIYDYIEVEAQDSQSQNQHHTKLKQQEETEGEDESNISSLIGEDVTLTEEDEIQAHKKFVSDMILQEQRRFQQMRKKIQKQYLQQEKRESDLKERMRQAKIALRKKEAEENYPQKEEFRQEQADSQNSTQKKRNIQKLQQLGIELGFGIHQSEEKKATQPHDSNRLKQLESCALNVPCGMQKLKRQGLKGINLKKNVIKDDRKRCLK